MKAFGTFAAFKEAFTASAVNQFGSGYAWLTTSTAAPGELTLTSLSNQDSPFFKADQIPLLTVDVWEHACTYQSPTIKS